MNNIFSFWSGKTVLVTGATGFLGGWLIRRLLDCGAQVVALVRSHKPSSQFFLESFDDSPSVTVYWGDVSDQALIEQIFYEHPIEVFFHTAYGADVHRVLEEPLECFRSSAISTWQILDFLRKRHPNCISVINSTDKVYGRQPTPYREGSPLQPCTRTKSPRRPRIMPPKAMGRCTNYQWPSPAVGIISADMTSISLVSFPELSKAL